MANTPKQNQSISAADDYEGPWIDSSQLPDLRQEFDMNRDPYIRAQLLDMQKTESQRREETSGRGSSMIEKDKPQLNLRPPQDMAQDVDREQFQKSWMEEQREAAMAQAAQDQRAQHPERERHQQHTQTHGRTGPSR